MSEIAEERRLADKINHFPLNKESNECACAKVKTPIEPQTERNGMDI